MKQEIYNEPRFTDFRQLINHSADKYGKRIAFKIKTSDSYMYITYKQLKERFYTLCNEFISSGLLGKRIAIIGKNSFEWVLSYLAAATIGVAVPLDKEIHPDDAKAFMESAECEAICYGSSYAENIHTLLSENVKAFSFTEIMSMSEPAKSIDFSTVDNIKIEKDEMRVLIFTSGTTGSAKGVCLSQYNLCSNIHSTVSVVRIRQNDTTLSILPLHHTYECTLDCLLILSRGAMITYCDGVTEIAKNFVEYSPSILVVVPALLKLLNKRITKSIIKSCPDKYKEFYKTESLAEALRKTPYIIRKIICSKVRKSLGGRIRLFIVGAAELDTSLVDDFAELGIRTLQGYGLTECSPLLAGNNDFYLNAASTGIAIPGVTLKIDNPNEAGVGEILAKGENIMLGYYKDQEATDYVLRDGWFHTGDLGCMDPDGALYIKGRIKNVIVTQNGKNIYPEELENRLMQFPEIGEVLVLGSVQKDDILVKAKIFPNLDVLKEKLGRLPSGEDIHAAITDIIRDINKKIPTYKQIKETEILTNVLEKTTTQKIKRFGSNMK
ncbi:MAG TPA: AMP-binding protein [Clostridia bacterium]|jgi:long-chain acyl-CoA synthetase|nr:AMP-binding protein [Clostridia bacterium]NLV33601.1 long-chain fatty acid--CoA ligase [Clostridiaceae bacterium]HPB16985.1 AMP-binding protein [Clostridia bacterium]HQM95619.1 AMP-binding protein [Clostridia bacterium]HQO69164.1 AMP-binding protein [Clostridia bacterium]